MPYDLSLQLRLLWIVLFFILPKTESRPPWIFFLDFFKKDKLFPWWDFKFKSLCCCASSGMYRPSLHLPFFLVPRQASNPVSISFESIPTRHMTGDLLIDLSDPHTCILYTRLLGMLTYADVCWRMHCSCASASSLYLLLYSSALHQQNLLLSK